MNQEQEQLPPSSTDPRPPTGQTPTQPPLSSSSTVGSSPVETKNQIAPLDHMSFMLDKEFFIEKLEISSSDAINKLVFSWKFEDFLNFMSREEIIWQAVPILFSSQFNIQMELIFHPIKVGDSIVTLDYLWTYETSTAPGGSDKWQNDWQELVFVDSKPISVKVPLFWMMEMITTSDQLPYFIPYTKLRVEIKNKYAPPPIHPSSFKVLVFGKFTNLNATEVRVPNYSSTGPSWIFDL